MLGLLVNSYRAISGKRGGRCGTPVVAFAAPRRPDRFSNVSIACPMFLCARLALPSDVGQQYS